MLPRVWKHIYGGGDDAEIARRLYAAIETRFRGIKARGTPVCGKILEDRDDEFFAVTNCGWWWLELEAWALRRGVHHIVMSMEEWDEETVADAVQDAEQISL